MESGYRIENRYAHDKASGLPSLSENDSQARQTGRLGSILLILLKKTQLSIVGSSIVNSGQQLDRGGKKLQETSIPSGIFSTKRLQ